MSKQRKIFYWIMGGLGAFLALLMVFLLLAPKFINLEPVRTRAVAILSEKIGGEIHYQRVDLTFFPSPCAVVHHASISLPGRVEGSLDSVQIYPRILPLLKGQIRLREVRADKPEFTIKLPGPSDTGRERSKQDLAAVIEEGMKPLLAPLALETPDLSVVIRNGQVYLWDANKPVFTFTNVQARVVFPPEGFKVQLQCASSLWAGMTFESALDLEGLKAEGQVTLDRFQPGKLTESLFPNATFGVSDGQLNLTLGFRMDGLTLWEASAEGSFSHLTLFREDRTAEAVTCKSLEAALLMNEKRIEISLEELNLEAPRLVLSGSLTKDTESQALTVKLEGRDINLSAARKSALALMGDHPDVNEIFDIVREGRVPHATFEAQGSSPEALGELHNMIIRAHIVEGSVFVPNAALDLQEVKGEAVISAGVLEGKNLEARLGNSRASSGTLKVGLEGKDAPFHLEIALQADLTEVPPVLRKVVDDETFLQELNLLEGLKGQASGRLVLGESTASIRPLVDISRFNLSTRYKRIPLPLEIRGNGFRYGANRIAVQNLAGSVSRSTFSEMAVTLNLEERPYFEVTSGKGQVFWDELRSWLMTMEAFSALKAYDIRETIIALDEIIVEGPISEPLSWQFKTQGTVRRALVDTEVLPGTVEISGGSFAAVKSLTSQVAFLSNLKIRMLDANVEVSGRFNDYLEGFSRIDLSFRGDFNREGIKWLSDLIRIPNVLNLRTPLSFSEGHLSWNRGGKTDFKADMTVQGGPKLSTEINLSPGTLLVSHVRIEDEDQVIHIGFAFERQAKALTLEFQGYLTKRTLNRIFITNRFTKGWIKGDFKAAVSLKSPADSTATGVLSGEDFVFPLALDVPLIVDSIALKAAGNRIDLESAVFTWENQRANLEGNFDLSPEGLRLDMNLVTTHLDLSQISKVLGGGHGNDQNRTSASFDLPVRGLLRLRSDKVVYRDFTLSPLRAEISLKQGGADISVKEAGFCGISVPGSLAIGPKDWKLAFKPFSEEQPLEETIECLSRGRVKATGIFSLKGVTEGKGPPNELLRSLEGNVELTAKDGRIYKSISIMKVFAFLSLTEILRGKVPDMGKEGFGYYTLTVKANLKGGVLEMQEAVVDGATIDLFGEGQIDLITLKIDARVLAAVLKTSRALTSRIPLVSRVFKGPVLAVPVSIKGDLANPEVRALSPSSVGSHLLGITKGLLKAPIEVIRHVLPGKDEEQVAPQGSMD